MTHFTRLFQSIPLYFFYITILNADLTIALASSEKNVYVNLNHKLKFSASSLTWPCSHPKPDLVKGTSSEKLPWCKNYN